MNRPAASTPVLVLQRISAEAEEIKTKIPPTIDTGCGRGRACAVATTVLPVVDDEHVESIARRSC